MRAVILSRPASHYYRRVMGHLLFFVADQVNEFEIFLQEALLYVLHPGGQGGTEQQGLDILSPTGVQNELHIVHKTHVEHLVTLVQHTEPEEK
jgi:hypothetical protein